MSITILATSDTELRRERTVGPALHRGSTAPPCPAFRESVLNPSLVNQAIVTLVIEKLRSLELMLVSDMQLHPQSFFDLVNIIRENPTAFPEWHASDTAQLYSPAIFKNKKGYGGYWF